MRELKTDQKNGLQRKTYFPQNDAILRRYCEARCWQWSPLDAWNILLTRMLQIRNQCFVGCRSSVENSQCVVHRSHSLRTACQRHICWYTFYDLTILQMDRLRWYTHSRLQYSFIHHQKILRKFVRFVKTSSIHKSKNGLLIRKTFASYWAEF